MSWSTLASLTTSTVPVDRAGVGSHGDGDATEEGVLLLLSIIPDHDGELGHQRLVVDGQPVVVLLADMHGVDVGHDGARARDHGGPCIHLVLQGGGHLDGLQFGLEGLREGAVHSAVDPLFETIQ